MEKPDSALVVPSGTLSVDRTFLRRRRLLKGLVGFASTAPLVASFAARSAESWDFLMNRWKQDQYLNIQNGPVTASQIQFGWWSAQWSFRTWVDTTIYEEWKAKWYMSSETKERIEAERQKMINFFKGWYFIQNRWKPDHFLHVENGVLEAGPISTAWESTLWAYDDAGDNFVRIRNRNKTDWYIQLDAFGKAKAGPIPAGHWSGHWRRYRL